jgi:hypothetical protein
MRTFLPLGLFVAGLGTLVGCSSDEDKCPPGDRSAACVGTANGGSGGQVGIGQGGTGTTPGGGGSAQTGQGGGSGSTVTRGNLIEFVPETPTATSLPFRVSGTEYGISGASFVDRSPMGTTFTATAGPAGELCVAGSYQVVPNGDYGNYWGVDFGFNLSQSTTPTAPDPDAGADAGGGGALDPLPWNPPANVIGFSFVITGGNTGLIRFRSRPAGLDPMAETSIYCKPIPAPAKDVPTDVLFADVKQQCWNPGTPAADVTAGFDRISWNLPADVMATQPAPVNFDFCIKELRPILSAP